MNRTLKTWEVYKLLEEWDPESKPIVIRNKHNLNMYEFFYNKEDAIKGFKFKNNNRCKIKYTFNVNAKWEIVDEECEAEKRKWEKWGRKVNEWKVGDIVRFIMSNRLGEINHIDTRGTNKYLTVSTTECKYRDYLHEMVCTVENRVDINDK